ncbi:MAG: bifunctional diaminohydroxyphosphoribosylaminopyrimidine deaminase/5-amino-6-(5-phosphoribosylamino)uracil reductase RibD [Gammaproteobacteria bacterium]|nr:bifunctional diaminohydroxyphosphoribosylaminopyrimidine deaminase/5-amino-6-(5-phosphoribosylamino)uracil reductase RibD [Gammaproteobacteria bacterium]
MSEYHHYYMQHAFALAKRTTFHTSPNPRVGCVIVKNASIIGEGWHNGPGSDHAEIMALKSAKESVEGADVYVTLEPCCHYGLTPPCTHALIREKIKCVYMATVDPNPAVSGKGIKELEDSGIVVTQGVLAEQAEKINRYYVHFMKKQRPYIICKWAMSLDGYCTTSPHDETQISSLESQKHSHLLRHQVDAILIGYKTALMDNPQLTTRFFNEGLEIRHPMRFILDSKGHLPLSLKIFSTELPGKTIVVSTEQSSCEWRNQFKKNNIEVWILKNEGEHVSLKDLMHYFYQNRILSVLVEGGKTIHTAFFKADLVDEVRAYIAPVIIGGHDKKKYLSTTAGDVYVRGYC